MRRQLPWWLAAIFTVLAGLLLAWLANAERQRWESAERNRILVQLDTIRSRLEGSLTAPLLRMRGMAAHIVAHKDITQAEFDITAEYLLRGHRNVRSMVVSRGLVIAMSYPLAGNEAVIGVSYESIPAQYKMVRQAIDTHSPVMQGPVPLIQGGTGLIARFPVFLRDKDGGDGPFFGMVNIILDVGGILAEAGLDREDLPIGVSIRGRDGLGAAGAAIHGDEAIFAQDPVEMDVTLPHGSWRLAAVPKGGWAAAERELTSTWAMIGLIFVLAALAAFGTARHITERNARERALRAKTQDLERSNADLERFAYVASHDLQTPLRNIASYTQLLDRRYRGRLDDDADQFIDYIVDGCKRMSQMVIDLLNYARVASDGGPLAAVSSREAIDLILVNLKTQIENSGAQVTVGQLPMVLAAPVQLASVFQNLIGNAIKYRAPDRQVAIAVRANRDPKGMWRFAVTDNGIGIDREYFDKIFEFFERLHPPTEAGGTGVGLAICHRIVHRFGGEIWVESVPGSGSTFYFTVPPAAEG
jgi:signal transduction histidine kinase